MVKAVPPPPPRKLRLKFEMSPPTIRFPFWVCARAAVLNNNKATKARVTCFNLFMSGVLVKKYLPSKNMS
jgi:hypothetical protein